MSNKQPNILFAFADDQGRYASVYRQVEGDQTLNALLEAPILTASPMTARCSPTLLCASSCTSCRSSPSKLLASRSKLLPLSDENLQTNRYQTTISVQQVIANLHLLAYILGHYIGHSLPVGYCYLGPQPLALSVLKVRKICHFSHFVLR